MNLKIAWILVSLSLLLVSFWGLDISKYRADTAMMSHLVLGILLTFIFASLYLIVKKETCGKNTCKNCSAKCSSTFCSDECSKENTEILKSSLLGDTYE